MLYIPEFDYKHNGIPILSYYQIDAWGEKIVHDLFPQNYADHPDATNLKRIFSELKNWHFAGRYLSRSGTLLGLATFGGGQLEITDAARYSVKTASIPPRTILVDRSLFHEKYEHTFRFVLAHEIGHALMHERFCRIPENMEKYDAQGQAAIQDDEAKLYVFEKKQHLMTERDWIEWQANAFASALLMPKTAVSSLAEIARQDSDSPMEFANQLNTLIADVLRVSITAAFYRIKRLGYISEESVLQKNGIISL